MATDPVCKVVPERAAGKTEHAGQMYYFCSDICHKEFVAKQEKYTSGAAPANHSCGGGHKYLMGWFSPGDKQEIIQ